MEQVQETVVVEEVEVISQMKTQNTQLSPLLNTNQDLFPNQKTPFTSREPPPKGVRYRVEYRNEITSRVVHTIPTNRLDFELDETGEIFDIITTFYTPDDEFKMSGKSKELGAKTTPRVSDTYKKVVMYIHSQAIIQALRSVVKYYPGQNLRGDTIAIAEPYAILVHHEKELNEYKERCRPDKQSDPVCPKERCAYHEIQIMQDFLEHAIMPAVRLERERNQRGLETFDMMWLRLKPGLTIKATDDDSEEWYGSVVKSMHGGSRRGWDLKEWLLDYNGTYIGTRQEHNIVERFEGEQEIKNNLVIAESAFKEPLDESVRDLVEQGKKFFYLLTKTCQYYKGTTFGFPHHQIDGLVMVDIKKYYSDIDSEKSKRHSTKPEVSYLVPQKAWVTDCSCPVCRNRKEEKLQEQREPEMFTDYHGVFLENQTLTSHHFFLLPTKIWGFVFKIRTWEKLHIKSFLEPKFEQDMIDKLVMDPVRIKTMKALAGSYIRQDKNGKELKQLPWSADFLQGKGQGQIVLLHGKPGVGKTCTAEYIAEYTKRPLMILTSSDIGADPAQIERILSDGFKTASSWGAVLLIDEADVFMESRSTNDLTRNCLVAGFLRALEFYDGILFLTTNRVGAFDDAFISRIHVKLYYPEFNDEERQRVWQTFVKKLEKDRGTTFRVSIDAKDFIKGKEMREMKWNGREIRNAFQTAVALAEYDAETDEEGKILLKDTHLSSIVDMSRDFKRYIDDIHGADEDKRASIEHIRHDRR